MWRVDPLLGKGREINNYTKTVTRQRSVNSNRGTVFSVRSTPRCYKQEESVSELVGELVSEFQNCCISVILSSYC
jgi:hypothetical protein